MNKDLNNVPLHVGLDVIRALHAEKMTRTALHCVVVAWQVRRGCVAVCCGRVAVCCGCVAGALQLR